MVCGGLGRGRVEFRVSLTILIHGRLKTFGQATGATLIAMCLVHRAATLEITCRFAGVNAIAMNAALEETRTACRKLNYI